MKTIPTSRPVRAHSRRPSIRNRASITIMMLNLVLASGHPSGGSLRHTGGREEGRQRLKGAHGDVPGWVMVTLMSALLVAGIYAVAGPALINMFTNAINKVGGLK